MHYRRRFLPAVVLLAIAPASSLLYAKKPKNPEKEKSLSAAPPVPQMDPAQKALHALNRLTFGPRPGDLNTLNETGLDRWIDQQLDPQNISENPVLDAKLAPLASLHMSSAEMVQHYPTPQMLRAMLSGRLPWPSEPEARYAIQKIAARFQNNETGAKPGDPNANARPDPLQLNTEQKQVLENGKPEEQLALIESMPTAAQLDILDSLPMPARQKLYPAAPSDVRREIQMLNGPLQVVNEDLTESRLYRAIYSNRQLEEVLTDFWYNHFNVYLDKGADRYMVTSYERDVIRPHVLGRFEDLLLATAQSPAMLFYLDNWQSAGPDARPNSRRRQGLNENYGRELMELHTLGVDGGYSQHDVTEVARCFTGWTIREPLQGGGFEFNDRLHDKGEKHVLGVTIAANGGMEDGLKIINILAHHPSTAHFISKSLAMRFVSDDPSEELVRRMAASFTATDGDLREVMRTMFRSPQFWDPANFRSKVKSPLELVASAIRAVNGDVDYAAPLAGIMNQLGEPLYRKLEPTGYSNLGSDWLNSGSLVARMNFGMALAQGKFPGIKVDTKQFSLDASNLERSILLTDASPNSQSAIQAGISSYDAQQQLAAMAAGLTLGSPDFQRR
jgi:uncharacterized protein (DUF1800 family)